MTDNFYEDLGRRIGQTVDEKQAAYGDSFHKAGAFLRQYDDLLRLVRIFDKQVRIASAKVAFGESPYSDIAGYGLLGEMI